MPYSHLVMSDITLEFLSLGFSWLYTLHQLLVSYIDSSSFLHRTGKRSYKSTIFGNLLKQSHSSGYIVKDKHDHSPWVRHVPADILYPGTETSSKEKEEILSCASLKHEKRMLPQVKEWEQQTCSFAAFMEIRPIINSKRNHKIQSWWRPLNQIFCEGSELTIPFFHTRKCKC